MRDRLRQFFVRHRTLFWTLHSIWALCVGIAVLILAHERYGLVPWVMLFLGLTWLSTLYFNRRVPVADRSSRGRTAPPLRIEITSYLTRSMYQETLFFLLPFYWYSTVVNSVNVIFPIVLAILGVLSCLDLVFDRWLRTQPMFGMFFFSVVAFAALNLLIPMLLPIRPAIATRIAIVVAVTSALPLAITGARTTLIEKATAVLVGGALLALVTALPQIVAPAPLRVKDVVFAHDIDETTLIPTDTLGRTVDVSSLDNGLVVVARVFAPSSVPTYASLEWRKDGETFRETRDIEITAHGLGFRIWDRVGNKWPLRTGEYEVLLRTGDKRVFGKAKIAVTD